MKCLILLGLLTGALAMAQQDVRVHAREVNQDGAVTKARGDATISNGSVRIQADSIIYNRETGEAEATGKVRIQFLPKPAGSQMQNPMTLEERLKMMRRRFPPEIMAN